MLSWRCRRFRARFSPAEPAAGKAHRRYCADCDAYASTLERVAAAKLALPASLRRTLVEIPGAFVPRPVPPLPLPPALRLRLQGIARPGGRPLPAKPPEWIVEPRYAIAASLLLTVLSGALVGNPAEAGARVAGFVGRELTDFAGRLLPASPNENRGASDAPGRERRKP
jgi:hypothetical protein